MHPDTIRDAELGELRSRLAEAEETIRAIRSGEVDAVIVDGPAGAQVYALRGADQPYRALVEQMQEGAAILTVEGDVLYCNQRFADLVAVPLEEVIGGAIGRFLSAGDRQTFSTLLQAGSGALQGCVSGASRTFDAYLSLTTTVADGVERRTLIVADLSELVAAQDGRDRAEQESRAKDEFVAIVAHELRNPIGAISAAVHVLNHLGRDGEPAARARAVIDRQIDRLSRLLSDLLDAASVTTGKITLSRRRMNWAEIVERHLATLGSDEQFDRRIHAEIQPVWVDADADRLEQVLGNLLGNAVKYTDPGGHIHVALQVDGGEAVLRVTDDGLGIEANLLPSIFDLFAQGEQALDRRAGGLGIGLTVVRRLAEAHGGMVSAESDGPGRGSTFTVRLPRVEPMAAAVPPPAPSPDPERRRVLIVEDNMDSREMHRMALELAGHDVLEATDGAEGLALLNSEPVDVALIDIGLPGMNGYEVARRFRAEHPHDVLLVALTGYGAAEDRERSTAAGFDVHLIKPVDAEAIREILRRA